MRVMKMFPWVRTFIRGDKTECTRVIIRKRLNDVVLFNGSPMTNAELFCDVFIRRQLRKER